MTAPIDAPSPHGDPSETSDHPTMDAIVHERFGGPEVLRLARVEVPSVSDDEVLIEVRAASVNPYDWHMIRGLPYVARVTAGWRRPRHPTPGADVSGVVVAVGSDATQFAVGDEVFGAAVGTFAEYVAAKERDLVHIPATVSFEEAASAPMAGITALQAIRDTASLREGDRVLVNGAAGGVGTFAVQIAKALGGHVTGVCSTRNIEMVSAAGADEVIDYHTDDFTHGHERYDVFIDIVKTHSMAANRRCLTATGRYALVGAVQMGNWTAPIAMMLSPKMASLGRSQRMGTVMAKHTKRDMEVLATMMANGEIRPIISRTVALTDLAEAIAHLEAGHARGKVVVTT